MATQLSTNSLLGAPAFVAFSLGGGLVWLQYELAVPFAMIFIMVFIIPFFRRAGVISIYEYLEQRFGIGTRTLLSLAIPVHCRVWNRRDGLRNIACARGDTRDSILDGGHPAGHCHGDLRHRRRDEGCNCIRCHTDGSFLLFGVALDYLVCRRFDRGRRCGS